MVRVFMTISNDNLKKGKTWSEVQEPGPGSVPTHWSPGAALWAVVPICEIVDGGVSAGILEDQVKRTQSASMSLGQGHGRRGNLWFLHPHLAAHPRSGCPFS